MDSLATGLQSALSPLHGAGEDLVRIYPAGAADEVEENICRLDALFKGRLGNDRDARRGDCCPVSVVEAQKAYLFRHAPIEVAHSDIDVRKCPAVGCKDKRWHIAIVELLMEPLRELLYRHTLVRNHEMFGRDVMGLDGIGRALETFGP